MSVQRAPKFDRMALRQWRRYWIRDPLLGALNYAIHYFCRALPLDLCAAFGGFLGRFNGRYRFQIVRDRVVNGYTALSGRQTDADGAAMRLFDCIGRAMTEFSVLDRLWRAGRIAIEGAEHVTAERAAGRPVIVMGVHVNNWEVIGPALIGLGISFKFIYQPPRSRFEHRIAATARRRYGAVLLQPGVVAARTAHRLLVAEKGVLLIFADDERKGYVNAPLFGRPVQSRANLTTIARLAAASGAAVIPAYAERLGGARHRVVFLPPIELNAAALADNVARLDAAITPIVLARLDQWYMLVDYYRS
jgi:KDO2-lipid IV(A) lauroyltransferase